MVKIKMWGGGGFQRWGGSPMTEIDSESTIKIVHFWGFEKDGLGGLHNRKDLGFERACGGWKWKCNGAS